jgi:calcineurin-like phosphoesterase family protein
MKILFCGDTHANVNRILQVIHRAKDEGCDVIVQLGDFAYTGDHRSFFLQVASQELMHQGLNIVWVEGNHDNYDIMERELPISSPAFGPVVGMRWTAPRIFRAPRGHRWRWDDVSFLALGGAYSIDEDVRKPGRSWWWQETITEGDVRACGTGRCDVMITHDSPLEDPFHEVDPMERLLLNLKQDMKSRSNRQFLASVVRATRPSLLVHGHLHRRFHHTFEGTQVEGLSWDGDDIERQVMVWDTSVVAAKRESEASTRQGSASPATE